MIATWRTVPLYVMDFEGSPTSGVVEFGVVEFRDGNLGDSWEGLCRPVRPMSCQEIEVHGLEEKDLHEHLPFDTHFQQFTNFRQQGLLVAHNSGVENRFLEATWAVPPWVPDYTQLGFPKIANWGPWIDTLSLYRNIYPGLDGYGLMALIEKFNLTAELSRVTESYCRADRRKAHCALFDALGSAILLRNLFHTEGFSEASLQWLSRYSRGSFSDQAELF